MKYIKSNACIYFIQVTIIMVICAALLLIPESFLVENTATFANEKAFKKTVFEQEYVQATNTSINAFGLGNGRLLTAEQLKLINADHCSGKFLVFKCDDSNLCGGLGDREKGIISSFLLALLTNRTFIIQMTKPCELQQFLQPNIYNWDRCGDFLSKVPKENISELDCVVSNRKFMRQIQNFDFDSNWTQQVIILRFNAYVINAIRMHKQSQMRLKWLLNTTNEETIHLILHTLFKPRKRLLNDVFGLFKNTFRGKNTVCCHIRNGKNPSIPNDNKLPKGTPNASVIIDFLKEYDSYKRNVIYVATDSEDVRTLAQARLDSYHNINRTIVHIDRLGKLKKFKTEACEGLYTVLYEQYILSQCNTLVLTKSNYGGIAAYIRGTSLNLFLYHPDLKRIIKSNLTDMQKVFKFI